MAEMNVEPMSIYTSRLLLFRSWHDQRTHSHCGQNEKHRKPFRTAQQSLKKKKKVTLLAHEPHACPHLADMMALDSEDQQFKASGKLLGQDEVTENLSC